MSFGSFLEDYGGAALGYLGGGPVGAVVGDAVSGGKLWEPGGKSATSDIPGADRNNFNLPGATEQYNRDAANGHAVAMRGAPQSADSSYWNGQQQNLAQRLQQQMSGADSMSQLQLRQATDQNLAQQRSLAASASPQNAAMAQRLAMQNAGNINQGYGQQAAMLGIQERNAAADTLGGLAGQARGQTLQNNQFNANAQLQSRGINDAAQQSDYNRMLQNSGMQMSGNMGYEANQTARRGQDLNVPNDPSVGDRILSGLTTAAPIIAKAAMADGGVVTQPTHALIGEAGPEAVVPLDKFASLLKMFGGASGGAAQLASGGNGGGKGSDDFTNRLKEGVQRWQEMEKEKSHKPEHSRQTAFDLGSYRPTNQAMLSTERGSPSAEQQAAEQGPLAYRGNFQGGPARQGPPPMPYNAAAVGTPTMMRNGPAPLITRNGPIPFPQAYGY